MTEDESEYSSAVPEEPGQIQLFLTPQGMIRGKVQHTFVFNNQTQWVSAEVTDGIFEGEDFDAASARIKLMIFNQFVDQLKLFKYIIAEEAKESTKIKNTIQQNSKGKNNG